ncbi:MAG: 4-hydroxythreonine-4-phosphate dehydrogenase PdxA [Candidatus Omnitrophota bacterium]|nr:4-hydroxythreonine-4-phosphate dehydrogenase PdxA [Candidatus Omnitrophota bacterium]MDZ4243157.1 4-hydroxythreonine-4-phosphate dehydrogenase PdxA [Candidatus Omnitrophota bacterium]
MPSGQRPVIGITMGDPSGIGPEVIAKALADRTVRRLGRFTIIGDPAIFKRYRLKVSSPCEWAAVPSGRIHPGHPDRATGLASIHCLKTAVTLLRSKDIQALVTAPVSKEAITTLGPIFHGHTEFLAGAFGIKKYEMLFVSRGLRTLIVTRHIALKDVAGVIRPDNVYRAILMAHQSLKKYFKIARPRIAVCGLNPHAGEGGQIGREDRTRILPAVQRARARGIQATGPWAADTLFTDDKRKSYDIVIAMYHDQGLIPVKTLYFRNVVNLTVGLPFIRTSPAHGTAFDIAGKNKADPSSMKAAIRLAAELASR